MAIKLAIEVVRLPLIEYTLRCGEGIKVFSCMPTSKQEYDQVMRHLLNDPFVLIVIQHPIQ